ncbi:MAG: right-handed parallel beta-helix repeat-containing protein [Bacteroidales bacterium]|nr:right-handed parallel beta-helix repeat-containing protein [Bacteroidales bacterium]
MKKLTFPIVISLIGLLVETVISTATAQQTVYIDFNSTEVRAEQDGSMAHPFSGFSFNESYETNTTFYIKRGGKSEGFATVGDNDQWSNITIDAYGEGPKPILTSELLFKNGTNITIRNMDVQGVRMHSGHHENILVEDCIIHNGNIGVQLSNTGNNITVRGCEIFNHQLDGIFFYGVDGLLVEDCIIYNIDHTDYGGDIIQLAGADNVVIRNCFFDKSNSGNKLGLMVNGDNENFLVEGCYFIGPQKDLGDGATIHVSTKNMVMRYNVFQHATNAIYNRADTVDVYYNIFYENTHACGVSNSKVFNNVFYHNVSGIGAGSNSVAYNNVFILKSSKDNSIGGSISNLKNNYQNMAGTEEQKPGMEIMQDLEQEFVDPKNLDFHLKNASSPLRDVGFHVDNDINLPHNVFDYDSNLISDGKRDVGLFEYQGSYNTRPIAAYEYDTISSEPGSTITLENNESSDPDGDELQYYWYSTEDVKFSSRYVKNPIVTVPEFPDTSHITLNMLVRDKQYWAKPKKIVLDLGIKLPVDGESLDDYIKVGPNPVTSEFRIILDGVLDTSHCLVSIYNSNGTLVWRGNDISLPHTFDATFLKQGIYFVQVYNEKINHWLTLVKE